MGFKEIFMKISINITFLKLRSIVELLTVSLHKYFLDWYITSVHIVDVSEKCEYSDKVNIYITEKRFQAKKRH